MTEFKKFAKELLERAVTDDMVFMFQSSHLTIERRFYSNNKSLYIRIFKFSDETSLDIIDYKNDKDIAVLYENNLGKRLPTVDELLVLMQKHGFYEEE